MKVDLPQPESAATPIRVTFSPGLRAVRDVPDGVVGLKDVKRVGLRVQALADAMRDDMTKSFIICFGWYVWAGVFWRTFGA